MKHYYKDNWITIYNMDCIEGMLELKPESVDLIISDFPYNISNDGNLLTKVGSKIVRADFGEWDKFNVKDYQNWIVDVFKEFERLVKPQCQVYAWFTTHYAGHYAYLIEKHTTFRQKAPIVCYKKNPIPHIRKTNFRSSFDLCTLFVKDKDKKCKTFNFLSQAEMLNVQEYNLKKYTKHPTEKNLDLVKRFIKISSNERDIVLDSFLGSGTTAKGCKDLNRFCIGFDTKQEYCDMSVERVRQDKLF